jgi:hypothetical protein
MAMSTSADLCCHVAPVRCGSSSKKRSTRTHTTCSEKSTPLDCRYITGTWTNDDLSQKWTGLKFLVVDAEFSVDGSDEKCLFVISPGSLIAANECKSESTEGPIGMIDCS